jgi:23S rRNA pseudouridine2605 synthase
VFEALPDDLPRVVAVGRLDINTEGLLLLTNDGGLARVIAHPDTGWLRRYRVRAHGGAVTQEELNGLRGGITIDGIEYGPVEANLDRAQGDNVWITLGLREGKNREVKRILEHMGLQVNRLIRLSFGPFQLGDLESGLVEEVRTRVLKDQLGDTLSKEAGVDFDSPVREPIAPFGTPVADVERGPKRVRSRSAADTDRWGGDNRRPPRGESQRGTARPARSEGRPARGEARPVRGDERAATPRRAVWRADEPAEGDARPARPYKRREDPKAERQASAERQHERVGAIRSNEGRKVLVERLVPQREPEALSGRPGRETAAPPRRERGAAPFADKPRGGASRADAAGERPGGRKPSGFRDGNRPRTRSEAPGRSEAPARVERGFKEGAREPGSFSARPARAARDDRPARSERPARAESPRGAGKFGADKFGSRAGARPLAPVRAAASTDADRGRPPAWPCACGPERGRHPADLGPAAGITLQRARPRL